MEGINNSQWDTTVQKRSNENPMRYVPPYRAKKTIGEAERTTPNTGYQNLDKIYPRPLLSAWSSFSNVSINLRHTIASKRSIQTPDSSLIKDERVRCCISCPRKVLSCTVDKNTISPVGTNCTIGAELAMAAYGCRRIYDIQKTFFSSVRVVKLVHWRACSLCRLPDILECVAVSRCIPTGVFFLCQYRRWCRSVPLANGPE